MVTISVLRIIFFFALLFATGNTSFVFGNRVTSGRALFFENSVLQAGLPNAAGKPLPPSRREGSRAVGLETSADVAVAIDMRSGKTLFEKKADAPMPLASFTKLMTALVFLDAEPDWYREIAIIENDIRENPSYFNPGDTVSVRDLFYAALVSSDNTAAAALARSTRLSFKEFVSEMNAKASEIGMLHANFSDVTGLVPTNTATALDVAVMARAAFSREEIRQALTMPSYDVAIRGKDDKKTVYTTDRLLEGMLNREPFKIQGGKTGYIEESGFNFVFEVKGEHLEDLLVVIMGSESHESRFEEAKNLALWVFENFDWER